MRLVIAGVLALVLTACITPGHDNAGDMYCLTITCFPSQRPLGCYPLPAGGEFSLSFIHSVSKTPVRDDYHIVDAGIVQVAEIFQAHGAGLPSGIDEVGVTRWEHHDGKFVIYMERPISRLVVRTDRNYRNRLHFNGRNVNLNQWDDQALELAIVPCATPE